MNPPFTLTVLGVYILLMLVVPPCLLGDRPKPCFWVFLSFSLIAPILGAIQLVGKVFLYGGAGITATVTMLMNQVAPPKRPGPFESRLDLH